MKLQTHLIIASKMLIFIVLLLLLFVGVTGIAYGLVSLDVQIVRLLVPIFCVVILPFSFLLKNLLHIKRYRILILAVFIVSNVAILLDQQLIVKIACHSQNATPVAELYGTETNRRTISFCGLLDQCATTHFDVDNNNYEVCILYDASNKEAKIQFVNAKITYSDDPLVQISNEGKLLDYRTSGILVIETGTIVNIDTGDCYIYEVCNSSYPPFASVYRNPILVPD